MRKRNEENLTRIRNTARHLKPLLDEVVFVGSVVTDLLITDEAAPEIRPTIDVDLIIEISSYFQYTKLEKELRR